ncbi:MAG: hypothetical protein FRX49_00390 [Trebouxia sp. A1-2]|nr:MAG: hypothetical protein FRX49_00390 [Trebouxia sp. A1-2]
MGSFQKASQAVLTGQERLGLLGWRLPALGRFILPLTLAFPVGNVLGNSCQESVALQTLHGYKIAAATACQAKLPSPRGISSDEELSQPFKSVASAVAGRETETAVEVVVPIGAAAAVLPLALGL